MLTGLISVGRLCNAVAGTAAARRAGLHPDLVHAAASLSPGTFLAIVVASAIAGTISAIAAERGVLLPVVVLELLLGVVLGPHVIGFDVDEFIRFFSNLGLACCSSSRATRSICGASPATRCAWR